MSKASDPKRTSVRQLRRDTIEMKRQPRALLEAVLQAKVMARIAVVGAGMMVCVPLADRGHVGALHGAAVDMPFGDFFRA